MRYKIANWKIINLFFTILIVAVLIFGTALSVCAVDNKYTFSDIKMSIKIPRDYITVTKDLSRDDMAFETLDLDYDETITAFKSAGIYLQSYDEEKITKITLTVVSDEDSKKINNYSDITATQRQEIIDAFLEDETYLTGVEKKHGGNIFLDFTLNRKNENDDKTVYVSQCNTVINGMNINLTMQKTDEPFNNDDNKVLDSIAESISFDKIILKTGPAFDWWRVVLVLGIMAAIAVAVSYIYKQYNEAKRRKLKERRNRSRINNQQKLAQVIEEETKTSIETVKEETLPDQKQIYQSEQLTFDELLGYQDESEYKERAATDLESYNINVKEKDINAGIEYFEDSGNSIDNRVDYFDSYFKESTKQRSSLSRLFSMLGAYIKIAFNHTRYFFKNLGKMISEIFKGRKKKN